MATVAASVDVPRAVTRKVSRLRALVRLYVLLEGIAALAIVVGLAFWIGLAIDWLLEPSPRMRVLLWLVTIAAAGWIGWRLLGRRLFAPLRDESLALLVERKHPALKEGLITAVATRSHGFEHQFHRELLEANNQRIASAMRQVGLVRVFAWRPLLLKLVAAAALIASIAGFAYARPEPFEFYLGRIKLGSELWPRRVALSVVGFEEHEGERLVNVARDDDFELVVLASIKDGHEAPEEVDVRWRRENDGGRGSGPMVKIGAAVPGRDEAQEYRYKFKVGADIVFDVVGGDDRVRDLRLRAVERPAVTRVSLDCRYPKYLERENGTLAVSGTADLPEGTAATCRIEANKPLAAARVHDGATGTDLTVETSNEKPGELRFELPAATTDRVLLISLKDQEGVETRDPFRLSLRAVPDEAPEATVQLRGIGSAVTPQAIIRFGGQVTDDHALESAWFDYAVNGGEIKRRPLRTQPTGLADLPMTEPFDLAETDPATNQPRASVEPGQKLALAIRATDAYDLSDKPHEGGSERFVLDVVTPSQLRGILEKRELALRQRFEAIHEKMVGVEQLLDRIEVTPEGGGKSEDGKRIDEKAAAPAEESGGESDEESPERARQRDHARIAGAGQSAAQLSFETTGVATGFDDIVAELINNRVETEELKERLEGGISEPLKAIGGEMLPRFERKVGELQTAFDADPAGSAGKLAECRGDAEAIVDAMQAVLDRMLELESYNEIVELLRGIVSDQQQIEERTKAEQKEKLRGLLDE